METKDIREVIEIPEGYEVELVQEDNTLNIIGYFNEDMMRMVYEFVRDLDEEDDEPIKINISSPGGEADTMTAIIDLLESTGRELHATVHGYAYSSALGLFCACHKRSMGRLSKLMYHNCIYSLEASLQTHKDVLEETIKSQEEYDDLIINASNITHTDLEQHKYRDWYINKEEAIKLGFVNVY